jgi:hypothetical protein
MKNPTRLAKASRSSKLLTIVAIIGVLAAVLSRRAA